MTDIVLNQVTRHYKRSAEFHQQEALSLSHLLDQMTAERNALRDEVTRKDAVIDELDERILTLTANLERANWKDVPAA